MRYAFLLTALFFAISCDRIPTPVSTDMDRIADELTVPESNEQNTTIFLNGTWRYDGVSRDYGHMVVDLWFAKDGTFWDTVRVYDVVTEGRSGTYTITNDTLWLTIEHADANKIDTWPMGGLIRWTGKTFVLDDMSFVRCFDPEWGGL